jgi:hypothetical protein
MDPFDLVRQAIDYGGIDTESALSGKGLPGQLEEHSPIFQARTVLRHSGLLSLPG